MKRNATTILLFILLFSTTAVNAQQIIAHRGYWKTDGSAQNSITALMKADSISVYGSEVDVWLSSDGVPVANHDATVMLNGVKITVEETPLSTLRQVKLSNGETLPTVEEYLDAFAACSHTRLIIEFKTHSQKEREEELARKVIKMVHERGLQEKVEYIAFGIHFVLQARQLDPQAAVYYLNGDLSPGDLSVMRLAGFDYHHSVVAKKPEWVQAAHELGQMVNVWTVNTPEDIRKMIGLKVDFITTDEPLLVKEILQQQ